MRNRCGNRLFKSALPQDNSSGRLISAACIPSFRTSTDNLPQRSPRGSRGLEVPLTAGTPTDASARTRTSSFFFIFFFFFFFFFFFIFFLFFFFFISFFFFFLFFFLFFFFSFFSISIYFSFISFLSHLISIIFLFCFSIISYSAKSVISCQKPLPGLLTRSPRHRSSLRIREGEPAAASVRVMCRLLRVFPSVFYARWRHVGSARAACPHGAHPRDSSALARDLWVADDPRGAQR